MSHLSKSCRKGGPWQEANSGHIKEWGYLFIVAIFQEHRTQITFTIVSRNTLQNTDLCLGVRIKNNIKWYISCLLNNRLEQGR